MEFYETPHTFTRYLFRELSERRRPITGRIFEPCCGAGAIIRASGENTHPMQWVRNDLDTRWPAEFHADALSRSVWVDVGPVDWVITNPPFTPALDIASHALDWSTVGVAMHLRASIHEVLKTGVRRTWFREHQPTGIVWLPRFAYQRSKTTGKWTTDSVCACWVVWLKNAPFQFIDYAPEYVIDELHDETPAYRERMDALGLIMRRCAT